MNKKMIRNTLFFMATLLWLFSVSAVFWREDTPQSGLGSFIMEFLVPSFGWFIYFQYYKDWEIEFGLITIPVNAESFRYIALGVAILFIIFPLAN